MIGRFGHLGPVFFHLAVRSDPYGGADHAQDGLAVHLLFTEGFVSGHHQFFRVAEQRERNVVFLDEFPVGGLVVRRNAENDGVAVLEFTQKVTESLGFLGSPGGVVFGIKIENHVFPREILQGNLFAVLIGQGECRGFFAFLDGH